MSKKIAISIFLAISLVIFNVGHIMAEMSNDKEFYSINENFRVVNHGKVSIERANQIIDEYIEAQRGLSGESGYVISKSMFGFSVDDQTFIEIYIDDEHTYRMKFECPSSAKWLLFNALYQKEISVADRAELKRIVEVFFNQNIDDFKKYFDSL